MRLLLIDADNLGKVLQKIDNAEFLPRIGETIDLHPDYYQVLGVHHSISRNRETWHMIQCRELDVAKRPPVPTLVK
jgi:hypothetical protein